MADKDKNSQVSQTNKAPKKRRWYNNVIDAYKITRRSFPWVGWVMLLGTIAVTGAFVAFALWQNMPLFVTILFGVSTAILVPLLVLSLLVKKAMYRQISGTVGSVYAVLSQIRRGWAIEEEPVAANRNQDLIWRVTGRPGVVLIAEGPKNRVQELANRERRRAQRVVSNLPVHVIFIGEGEGQTKLEDLEKEMRRLPKQLHRNEVPEVANRIQAISKQKRQANMPHGIDPNRARAKMSRRALRGR